jgi:Outer membrane protein beta-barrel domain
MKRRLLSLALLGALCTVPAALTAQLSTGVSIAAGFSEPTGSFSDAFQGGFNGAVGLNIGAPLIPVGFRLEGAYNGFGGKAGVNEDLRLISGTANATIGIGMPYIIGGVGYYSRNEKSTTLNRSDTESAAGINVGAGVRLPLGVMSTFVEVRYHKMLGDNAKGADLSYVPITFGIQF